MAYQGEIKPDPTVEVFTNPELPTNSVPPPPDSIAAPSGMIVASGDPNSPLTFESQGIAINPTGYIRSGQTGYNTGTGWYIGSPGGSAELSIGVGGSTSNSLTFANGVLTINGYAVTSKGNFGGNGADGALTLTSGTTTVSLGSNEVTVKNYTSISITGTGSLGFSNPANNGSLIILKSQAAVTLTATAPCIDASGMGAKGGVGGGTDGTTSILVLDATAHCGTAGTAYTSGGGNGTGGAIYGNKFLYTTSSTLLNARRVINLTSGSGGGGGGDGHGVGGAGGRGGGALLIECAGALNFTTALGISVAGATGSNGNPDAGTCGGSVNSGGGAGGAGGYSTVGSDGGTGLGGGPNSGVAGGTGAGGGGGSGQNTGSAGGGGGACGEAIVLYNTLTAASGTINAAGGAGGSGYNCSVGQLSNGGAAGASDSNMGFIAQNNIFG